MPILCDGLFIALEIITMNKEAGELIAILFLSREVAHRAHLAANGNGSYAAHIALNDFYDDVVENGDSIAEAIQGEYVELLTIPFISPFTLNTLNKDVYGNALAELKMHKEWIDTNRYVAIPKEKTPIHNLIDEAVHIYETLIYKLSFLK